VKLHRGVSRSLSATRGPRVTICVPPQPLPTHPPLLDSFFTRNKAQHDSLAKFQGGCVTSGTLVAHKLLARAAVGLESTRDLTFVPSTSTQMLWLGLTRMVQRSRSVGMQPPLAMLISRRCIIQLARACRMLQSSCMLHAASSSSLTRRR